MLKYHQRAIMGLFSKKQTPDEQFREFRKNIRKTNRLIDREIRTLQNKEIEIKNKVKTFVKQDENKAAVTIVKDMLRNRQAVSKFRNLQVQMDSILIKVMHMKAEMGVTQALKQAGFMMNAFNNSINLVQLNAIMQQFMRQNQISETKSEMIDDIINEGIEDEDIESTMVETMMKTFKELGVPLTDGLAQAISPGEMIIDPM
jgi:charged multivesicular body protein 3